MATKKEHARRYATPRRGYTISTLDAIVQSLWMKPNMGGWPALSFGDIGKEASRILGRQLNEAVVRGCIYRHEDLFDRVQSENSGGVKWRLNKKARET